MTTASIAQHVRDVQLALGSLELERIERSLAPPFGASVALLGCISGPRIKSPAARPGEWPAVPASARVRGLSEKNMSVEPPASRLVQPFVARTLGPETNTTGAVQAERRSVLTPAAAPQMAMEPHA
ncbi:hypothetical protein HNQ08_001927 [Deinococcus humi]|uniref:Uncharacterized protein n=1 Tax=Deinococcus humi TaxID=662880 RepID=A0A7W8JW98_9DEIO|nr:hypothetical protein [Deinococcus humi]GGO26074.1 hypothetical protein GCM10008949_16490 [Deinococcus humi]